MPDRLDRRTFTIGALATLAAGCAGPTIPDGTSATDPTDTPTDPTDTPPAHTGHTGHTGDAAPASTADTGPAEPSLCLTNGATGQVSMDPDHALFVPKRDIEAGVRKTYDIQGRSLHNHRVTLTPDDFARLAAGMKVEVTSTIDLFHDHLVLLLCV